MARLVISFFGKSKSRRDFRKAQFKQVPKGQRKEVRRLIARRLESESRKRLFSELKVRSRQDRKRITKGLFESKVKAIMALDSNMEEEDARELAETASMVRHSRLRLKDERPRFAQVKRKGKILVNLYQRARPVKKGKRKILLRYGPFLSVTYVRKSLAGQAYWARVKALASAIGMTVAEARKADKIMVDLPESVRRRIYESIVARFAK